MLLTFVSTALGCLALIALIVAKMSTAPSSLRHSKMIHKAQNTADGPVELLEYVKVNMDNCTCFISTLE